MAKELGGLTFWDLQGFNLALLGKQCWNLFYNPNSLVARVLKAKYYPKTTLFEASRGGGVSYVWSGLWQAKETRKQGYRCVVGDGRTINVSKDAWIREKDGNRVDDQYLASVNDLKRPFHPGSNPQFAGTVPVMEAEAIVMREAIRWIISMGMDNVDIESDSLCTVNAVNSGTDNLLKVGVIFQECRKLLVGCRNVLVDFIKRQANKVAHLIARVSFEVGCLIDILTPPQSMLELLISESLLN
ncbi:hypothetical protein AgCh_031307 [Apium graveolens]